MKYLLSLLLFVSTLATSAEVIPVTPIEDCFLCSNSPSMTMYWQSESPKAVMIVIPGGDGYIGITPERELKHYWTMSLKRLTTTEFTKGQVDLVMMDSPRPLSSNDRDLGGRGTTDHMIRIESVVRYYKEKTGLPVLLLGHSNGGPSIANFLHYLQDKDQLDLIDGVIASTTRHETNFPKNYNKPTLFVTNRQDGCRTLGQLEYLYNEVKESNSSTVEWVVVESGEPEYGKHQCYSGYHMFYKAEKEYSDSIDTFIDNVLSSD